MKRLIILATAIILASTAFAERSNFRDRTDNWLQQSSTADTNPGAGGGRTGGKEASQKDPTVVPIGNGLLLVTLAAGIYAKLRK